MRQVRLFSLAAVITSALTLPGCSGNHSKSDSPEREVTPSDPPTSVLHTTGEGCIEAAQLYAETEQYAEAMQTLRECEARYGVTVELVPTFPDRSE